MGNADADTNIGKKYICFINTINKCNTSIDTIESQNKMGMILVKYYVYSDVDGSLTNFDITSSSETYPSNWKIFIN